MNNKNLKRSHQLNLFEQTRAAAQVTVNPENEAVQISKSEALALTNKNLNQKSSKKETFTEINLKKDSETLQDEISIGTPFVLKGKQIRQDQDFKSFIEHPTNDQSLKFCTSFKQCTDQNFKTATYKMIYISARPGVGKTHLLNALALNFKLNHSLLYIQARNLKDQYYQLKAAGKIQDYYNYLYHHIELLLIDDINEVFSDLEFMLDFCDILDHFILAQKSLILSAEHFPHDYKRLPIKIKSRLEKCLLSKILPFDRSLADTYLKSIEKKNNHLLKLDQRSLLLDNFYTNAHSLESSFLNITLSPDQNLNNLSHEALLQKNEIDYIRYQKNAPLAGEEEIENLISIITNYFNINSSALLSKSRKSHLVTPRHITMYLLSHSLSLNISQIGRYLQMHHTSILHGVNRIQEAVEKDDLQIIKYINEISQKL